MKDMTRLLLMARNPKKFYNQQEFSDFIIRLQEADKNLKLDWDDGSGEEWARFIDGEKGLVSMINAKIGIAFVRNGYNNSNVMQVLQELCVERIDNYDTDEWTIDLGMIKRQVPEIYWHTSENAVNRNAFCLNDFYFATI